MNLISLIKKTFFISNVEFCIISFLILYIILDYLNLKRSKLSCFFLRIFSLTEKLLKLFKLKN